MLAHGHAWRHPRSEALSHGHAPLSVGGRMVIDARQHAPWAWQQTPGWARRPRQSGVPHCCVGRAAEACACRARQDCPCPSRPSRHRGCVHCARATQRACRLLTARGGSSHSGCACLSCSSCTASRCCRSGCGFCGSGGRIGGGRCSGGRRCAGSTRGRVWLRASLWRRLPRRGGRCRARRHAPCRGNPRHASRRSGRRTAVRRCRRCAHIARTA